MATPLKYADGYRHRRKLLELQGYACACCRRPVAEVNRLYIDHDHATGFIRGLLCHGCNIGLGHFQDNPAALLSAVAYLRRGPATEEQIS